MTKSRVKRPGNICNLMDSFNITEKQGMDGMIIPASEKRKSLATL